MLLESLCFIIGFFLGVIVGIKLFIYYARRKAKSELGDLLNGLNENPEN